MRSHNPANYRSCCEDETQRRNRTNLCKVATSPAIEFTQMNNAETAAAWRMCAHSQNSNSGVRNIPPPVPVRPERKPSPAPTLMATGREGASLRRVASAKHQPRSGKKQRNAYQNPENRSRGLQVT